MHVHAQSVCDVSITTTDVRCNGESSGTAKVVVNGQAAGNPIGCLTADAAPASYTANCTRTYSSNTGDVLVGPGEQVCLSGSNFTGGIQVTGGTLVITGSATPSYMNLNSSNPGFTLVVLGTAQFNSLNLFGSSTVKNYGTLKVPSVGFNGTLENNGTLTVTGDLNINAPYGNFTNKGSVTVSSNFNNFNTTLNGGSIAVTGTLNNNSGGTLNNQCTVTIGGDFNNNNKTINAGKITAGAKTALNGSSLYQGYAGSVLTTGSTTIDGTVQGMSSNCASIKVTNGAIVNSTAVFSGAIDYCAPNGSTNTGTFVAPATKNCSCTAVTATYAWQSPLSGTTVQQNSLAAGTYSVLVTPQGCAAVTKTFTINAPAALAAGVTPTGLSASVAASGGTVPYNYIWSGNQSTQASASYAASGSYNVQVKDSKGCSTTQNFTLTAPTTPPAGSCSITVVTKDPTCAGAGDGSATVYLNGNVLGTGTSGTGTQTPAGCSAAQTSTYTCTSGCTQTITDNNAGINIAAGQQVCLTATAYVGNINVTGGTLVLCGKATPQNINYNTNGAAFTLVVNGELTLSNLNLPTNCILKNYGKVTYTNSVSFNGRVENYGTMLANGDFNNNASTGTFFNYGSLSVSGNLNNNVQGTNSGILTITGNLHINGGSTFTNNCTIQIGNEFINNASVTNNGKITVAQWARLNGGSTTTLAAGASLNTQDLTLDGTVTGSGTTCSALKVTGQSIVNGSGKLQGQVSLCMGTGPNTFTGTVTAPATKTCSCVLEPIQYSSPLLGMNNPYQGLPAGTYSVTVQTEGCPATVKTFTITDPAALTASVAVSGKTATVSASGGQGALLYTWTGGASGTSNTHTFVNDGTYQVTVSDGKNCSKTISFQIPVQTVDDINCNKLFVEYIAINQVRITCQCPTSACTIIPSTGIPANPITTIPRPKNDSTVLVKTGPNTVIEVVVTGTYINPGTEVGTGSGGVENTLAITSTVTAESSTGKNDGSIQLTITGGSGDYSISNNFNTQTNTTTINNVGSGEVLVTVYDNKTGFTKVVSVPVGVKPSNTYQLVSTGTTSTGEVSGVQVQVTGTNPTTNTVVQWSTGQTGFGPIPVPAWVYTTGYITATISESWSNPKVYVLPVVTACSTSVTPVLASTPITCYGSANGSASVTNLPAGASVAWSGTSALQTSSIASNLAAGTYRADVYMTLANGNKCKAGSATITLTDPQRIQVQVKQSTSNTSSYTAQVTGGTAPYTYQWSNSTQAATATFATGGLYQVQVQDSKGCVKITQLNIPNPPCGPGIALDITQLSCTSTNSGKILASTAISGAAYYWSATGIANRYTASQENLTAGTYVVSVIGWNPQCVSRVGVKLKQPQPLTAISKQIGSTVNIVVSNGTPNYKVVWRFDNKITDTRSDLTPGVSYTVDITDSKGCTLVYTFTYDPCSANPIKVSVKMNDNVATPQVSGGVGPYTYLWKLETQGGTAIPAGTDATAVQNNINGIYSLTVTDARSCNTKIQVSGPNCGMNGLTVVKQATSCKTICDGLASISGTLPAGATLTWNNQATAYNLVHACAGTHTVQISNTQGCFIEKEFVITAGSGICPNNNPEVANPPGIDGGGGAACTLQASVNTATSKLSKQCASEVAFIDVKITGGFAPYHMKWTVQRTQASGAPVTEIVETDKEDYQNALPGNYSLEIKDQRGCTKTVTATVTGPVTGLESTINEKAASCPEQLSGITFTLSGGVGPYTIEVLSSAANPSEVGTQYAVAAAAGGAAVQYNLSPGQGGAYRYKVRDAAGCTQIRSIALSDVESEAKRFHGGIVASQTRLAPGQSAVLTAYSINGYTLNWANVAQPGTRSQTVSQPGVYQVTYSKTGCTSYTRSVNITALPADSIPKSMICTASQPVEIPIDLSDHCEDYQRLSAQAFGRYKYELYVSEQKQRIRNQYLKAVMGDSKETLTMNFADKEEHYTLYYYDQSGNLVRTIPPSGVKPLTADKTSQAIDQMLSGSTAVITEHDYTTTYGYNSLNQLVHQDIPDHDRIDLWETAASSIDLSGSTVANLAYSPTGNGGIMLANTADKVQLYSTADVGKTWDKNQNIGLGKITSISRVDASTVFAAGEKGTFLSSANGGRSWTLLPLLTESTVKQVYFSTASIGWIITESGSMYSSPDGGHSWNAKTALQTAIGASNTVTEASVNKSNGTIQVISSANKIYQSIDNGAIWTEKTIESPTVTTVSVLSSTDLIAAGPKGTLFKANAAGTSMTVQRTGLDKTISKLLAVSANTYYAITSDGLVYYSTAPATWTQVSGVSGITSIVKEGSYILLYDASGVYNVSGTTGTALPLKRVRNYAGGYVGLTSAGAVVLLDNNLTVSGGFTLNGLSTITIKDMYVIGTKLIILGTDNNVYEGTPNGTAIDFTVSTPKHTGVNSFVTQGTDLYVRTNSNTILAYGSTTASVTLNSNVTDVALSSANSGYAVESGKVKKITAGVVSGTPVSLISSTLNALAADGAKTYAAGENGELYVSTGTTFSYVPVVNNASSFIDAAYSSTQGRLELITTGSQLTYNETTTALTTSATTYSSAKQISTTATAGQVLVASSAAAELTETTYSVEGSSYPYLTGGDAGKIWYQESAAAAYTPATINIQPLAGIAYATANTVIAVGKQGTVLRSTDAGVSWKMEYSGTPNDLTMVSAQGTTAVIIGANNTVLYNSATAPIWKAASGAPAGATSVKVAPNVTLLTAGTSVYKSTNAGAAFAADAALTGNTATLRSVWIDKDGYGFVVGDNGAGYRITPTSTTTNTSFVYTKIATDAAPNDDKGTGLPVANFKTVQFSDRMVGYITAANGLLLKTTDGGAHWKQETNGVGTGSGTPQIALSSDAQHGTVIDASGTAKVLRDQAETFSSRFWYDELGRLVLSQNAKQFNITSYEDQAVIALATNPITPGTVRAYSYTLYDKIGRIVEVGELLTDKTVTTYKNESQVLYANHTAFVATTTAYRHQTSKTYYDRNQTPPQDFTPTYLRNRVAYTTYQQTANSPLQQTHYSYDVHGNVNNLLQLITHDGNVLAKTVNYEYDLISGKVNKVYFQKEKADQLIHRYTYDGDNRITQVETSTDNVLFTKEASYQYYAHGPLARTQLGELNVETENYTYTIQGWIKQMQAEAFSYALGYNDKDYTSIGTTATILATPIATVGTTSKGLYNGNIASMTSKTPIIASTNWQQQYSYDQLNRITASNTPSTPASNAYKTTYSYDANGNILNLARYDGENTKFDELSYNYQTKAKGYLQNTNKLRWVDDAVGTSATTADIEDQSLDNYSYDAIGNLIKDNQEEIAKIEWTVSGKVRKVIRTLSSTKPNLEFEYDASGQRIVKKVIRKDGSIASTYYLRDATGNVMSVYTYNSVSDDIPKLSEQYLYGSSRIGVATPGAGTVTTALKNILGSRAFGRKSYELSDHLGNVRATLSDYRRLAKPQIVHSATDYYPFGFVARVYASAEQYRYGYNTQEKVDELGEGHTTALYWEYDARLGKRWNVDPVVKAWSSSYVCFSNNPIVQVDPLGNTDFYTKTGNWIGTDGQNNSLLAVVTSKDIIKEIKKATKQGLNTKDYSLTNGQNTGGFNVIHSDILKESYNVLSKAEQTASNPTQEHIAILKTKEEGGYTKVFEGSGGEKIIDSEGGERVKGPSAVGGNVSIHSHPIGLEIKPDNSILYSDALLPSSCDKITSGDLCVFGKYDLNIIVGKNGSNVTYDLNQSSGKMEWKDNRALNINVFDSKGGHLFSIDKNAATQMLSGEGNKKAKEKFLKPKTTN